MAKKELKPEFQPGGAKRHVDTGQGGPLLAGPAVWFTG
jgi:hypothetical protein